MKTLKLTSDNKPSQTKEETPLIDPDRAYDEMRDEMFFEEQTRHDAELEKFATRIWE